ncbi:MAG: ABC transporter ATP-binding protein [Chloroflexota bacterium]
MFLLAWWSYPSCFTGALLLEAIQGLAPLASAWITKLLFDFLALGLQGYLVSWQNLVWLMALQVGLLVFIKFLLLADNYLSSELSRHLILKIQVTVYHKIHSLAGLAPFENPKTQDTIHMGTQGAHMGSGQMLSFITSMLNNSLTSVSFLGVLLVFNPWLALLVALAAIPQICVQINMGRQRFGLAYENTSKQRRVGYYGYLLSGIECAKELRLFSLGGYFLEAFRKLSEELQQTQRTQQLREIRWQAGLNLLANGVSSIAFVAVVMQAFRGHLSLGDVTLYTAAVSSVQGALSGIVYAFSSIHESALFFSRYTELMALPQPIAIPAEPRAVPALQQGIELRRVSFRYSPEHPWVLKDVSLTIPAGSCLALVGLNGAGKTTLVKLLTRMYDPLEGQILWDGVDIREFDPADLRQKMGAIFQDFVHYDLTAFENIALGDVSLLPSPEGRWGSSEARFGGEVERAAQKAGVHETITALPQGYDTVLSRWLAEEGQGADLSGGEWQKLALARLFMREKANLLILDEPTAALDAQAEYDVYSRFVDLVNGRTSLLISHRFSTVRMADAIAVLEDGRIVEYGSHDDLCAAGNGYARLYKMQAERYR